MASANRSLWFAIVVFAFLMLIAVSVNYTDMPNTLKRYSTIPVAQNDCPTVNTTNKITTAIKCDCPTINTTIKTTPVVDKISSRPLDKTVRIIHQSWKVATLPKRFAGWSKSWSSCFPGWERKLWTDADNRDLIVKEYPWFLSTYDSFPSTIYRADAARIFYMFHYGGIYADLDADCLQPFEHLLTNHSIVFGAMEGKLTQFDPPEGYVQNSFMYSRAKHPFWINVIMKMINRTGPRPEHVTGPLMLMEVIWDFRKRHINDTETDSKIKIYPGNHFNPFSWLVRTDHVCQDLNNMDDAKVKECREQYIKKKSYVLQYHTQVWRAGKVLRRKLLGI